MSHARLGIIASCMLGVMLAGCSKAPEAGTSNATPSSAARQAEKASGAQSPPPAAVPRNSPEPAATPAAAEASRKDPDSARAADTRALVPQPAASAAAAPMKSAPPPAKPVPAFREVKVPAGTVLPIELQTSVASDTSRVEDPVEATLTRTVSIGGVSALPSGTRLRGHVTAAARSGRVKGRARLELRFTRIHFPGEAERLAIRTTVIAREAEGTQKKDAAKVGGGAAGGAIIGGILGGGGGAAKGAAIGGAAGTGIVLSTRGKEVRLAAGTPLSVKLLEPVTVRVRSK